MHRILFAPFVVAGLMGLAACNTVKGAGEDVSAAGEAMSDTAQDAEDEIEE